MICKLEAKIITKNFIRIFYLLRIIFAMCCGAMFSTCVPTVSTPDDGERLINLMRGWRPSSSTRSQLLEMLETTRPARRSWIAQDSPTITAILQRFPRFQDMNDAVSATLTIMTV